MLTKIVEHFSACLTEDARIDVEAGILRGVKINGNVSSNRRRYSDRVLEQATPLFEGAKVYENHVLPDRYGMLPARTRSEAVGRLRNVRFLAGGHRADMHVLPSKRALLDDLKYDPQAFGLSQVIDARTEDKANAMGEEVIAEIVTVHSVDIVTEPATTAGIFEQRTTEDGDMDAKQMQAMYEERVTNRDEKIKSLTEQIDQSKTVVAELEATKAQLDAVTQKLEETEGRIKAAEDKARAAEIASLVTQAGLATDVAESLKALTVEDAKKIIESLKQHAPKRTASGSPRSEQRSSDTGSKPALKREDLVAAMSGRTRTIA